jgi:hypothetical protein
VGSAPAVPFKVTVGFVAAFVSAVSVAVRDPCACGANEIDAEHELPGATGARHVSLSERMR